MEDGYKVGDSHNVGIVIHQDNHSITEMNYRVDPYLRNASSVKWLHPEEATRIDCIDFNEIPCEVSAHNCYQNMHGMMVTDNLYTELRCDKCGEKFMNDIFPQPYNGSMAGIYWKNEKHFVR